MCGKAVSDLQMGEVKRLPGVFGDRGIEKWRGGIVKAGMIVCAVELLRKSCHDSYSFSFIPLSTVLS